MNDSMILSPRKLAIRRLLTEIRVPAIAKATNFHIGDDLLTVAEVAAMLKVPVSTIYELTRTRSRVRNAYPLPFIRVGKRLRFSRAAVINWLDQLEKGGLSNAA